MLNTKKTTCTLFSKNCTPQSYNPFLSTYRMCSSSQPLRMQVRSVNTVEIESIAKLPMCIPQEFKYQNSLAGIDIDNTILEPVQYLGSDHWFDDFYAQTFNKIAALNNLKIARRLKALTAARVRELTLKETLSQYHKIQRITHVKPVQHEETIKIFMQLQQCMPSILVTARGKELNNTTKRQLKTINFNIDQPGNAEIIYCAGGDKGILFKQFWQGLKDKPKNILFVDDKLKNLKSIENAFQSENVNVLNIYYSHVNKRMALKEGVRHA